MIVTGLRVGGLRGANDCEIRPAERLTDLPAGPAGVALADALDLFVGSLDQARVPAAVEAVGVAAGVDVEVITTDGLPTEASWPDGAMVVPLLDPTAERRVFVEVTLEPDPPLFGDLRAHAARDPRLVTALGRSPDMCIRTGWLFTPDHTVASIAIFELRIGEVGFPVNGKERPVWVPDVLREIASRFGRVRWQEPLESVVDRLLAASLSSDAEQRARYRSAARCLAAPPFSLGTLELVRHGDRVEACFGDDLIRLRQFGPGAATALRLVEVACLQAPDVLVVEAPAAGILDTAGVRDWLGQRTEGDDATLEQVLVALGGAA